MKKVHATEGAEWSNVQIEGFGDFEGLVGIEELNEYEIAYADEKIEKEKKKKSLKKKKKLKKQLIKEEETDITCSIPEIDRNDLFPWTNIFVPEEIAKALVEQGLTNPTEIQRLCIPSAIRGRRDIVGAAETGSGKTLAFGIPILHGIIKNLAKDEQEDSNNTIESNNSDKDVHQKSKSMVGSLFGLILAPTRELVVQVKKHLEVAAKYTPVKIAAVLGGMSIDKQLRILKKKPHLLIATPGRLWELMNQEPHLVNLNSIRFFAIDETDRMLERDHFPELRSILEIVQGQEDIKRQNFVFSATLTLVHEPPSYIKRKKPKKSQLTQNDKLNNLIQVVGMKDYKIFDISKKKGTAEALKEAKISCTFVEKDYFLYYFLKAYSGRTVIFCNSISCVRRLASLLGILACSPIPLHANMQQRQRLKNLDRFRSENNSILLSTDVAARGLDIPNIDNVIHYQVPRTSEGYVHRSGRTARASNEGITILLVEPSEIKNYIKICNTLGREKDLDEFPVDQKALKEAKSRVKLAREMDSIQRTLHKVNNNSSWVEKSAAELDIILDEDQIPEKFNNKELAKTKRHCMIKKKQLNELLSKPFLNKGSAINAATTDKKKTIKNIKLLKHKAIM